jgi:tRNA threonylcarbamoyladenosine biosynthesis protein TsaE
LKTDTHLTESEGETAEVGKRLAADLSPGTVVLLHGDLGAGKTAFVKGLAAGLGIDPEQVNSPTFVLIQEYRGGRLPLFHADLYRLDNRREIEDLGLEELATEGVLAIEWAEKLPWPMESPVEVRIEQGTGDTRILRVSSPAARL